MNEFQIFTESAILNKDFARKLCLAIDCAGRSMQPNDLMEVSFGGDTILIKTEGVQTIVKLERQ